jgi:hypothetical protein
MGAGCRRTIKMSLKKTGIERQRHQSPQT